MTDTRTPWKKLLNKDYLGECDFAPGEDKTVTIASIETREVTGDGGKVAEKPIMRFEEPVKPLILNTTNFKRLTKLFDSRFIEDWIGGRVTLYGDPDVKFGKETVGGVRIRERLPRPTSACADCGEVIRAADRYTAAQVEAATAKRYGVALCWECAKQRKEAVGAAN